MEQDGKRTGQEQQSAGNEDPQRKDRGPSPKEKAILKRMRENRNGTKESIAKSTGMTYESVTKAIDVMKAKGWVDRRYKIAPKVLGFPERYRVDIAVIPVNLRKGEGGRPEDKDKDTGERIPVRTQQGLAWYIVNTLSKDPMFADCILVEEVSVLLGGPSDISATVWAKDNESMLKFVTYGLRMAEGIQSTSTFVEHWSFPDRKI